MKYLFHDKKKFTLSIILIAFLGVYFNSSISKNPPLDGASVAKPNIIIIGVDALRPDYLPFFTAGNKPLLKQLFSHSIDYPKTLTPLARTFPAWVSILTGLYPKNTQMRYDLADQTKLNTLNSLPNILRAQGYATLYAMDETRFSNISHSIGFDKMITPPSGLNDFLLGGVNDFPLANLIANTLLGSWVLPFSYANRPAYITYNPDSFLKLLTPSLQQDRQKPLFFAVHFCLAHFPYLWQAYAGDTILNNPDLYKIAVDRVGSQVNDLLALLQANHILTHAVVILLSDHGEAFELDGDRVTAAEKYIPGKQVPFKRFYPPTFETEQVNQSAGHGNDVLSLSQSQTVLLWKFYNMPVPALRHRGSWVSLLDITPTLLDILKIPLTKMDGRSLLAKNTFHFSHFLMESDFSPEAVRTVHPEVRKILLEGINYYQINAKTGLITVKPSMGELIISSKQYADLYQDWLLALYPTAGGLSVPVLVNLKTRAWTMDMDTGFAKQSPYRLMLNAIQAP